MASDPGQKSLPWILLTIIGRSTRWSVAGLVALGLLLRRDAKVMNFTGGAILNALFGKVLKRIIKEVGGFPWFSEISDEFSCTHWRGSNTIVLNICYSLSRKGPVELCLMITECLVPTLW